MPIVKHAKALLHIHGIVNIQTRAQQMSTTSPARSGKPEASRPASNPASNGEDFQKFEASL